MKLLGLILGTLFLFVLFNVLPPLYEERWCNFLKRLEEKRRLRNQRKEKELDRNSAD